MIYRYLSLLFILMLTAAAVWAKGKRLTPQMLIERSDAVYYFPQANGTTDLAVDVSIAQLANDPVAGKALMTFCYLDNRREFVISNLTEQQSRVKTVLFNMVAPLGEYIVPRTSVEAFVGMEARVLKVLRQIAGQQGMTFYQLTGTPTDEKSPIKEYRVLVDEQGLAHQVETEGQDGTIIAARIVNTKIGDKWVITKISTRMLSKDSAQWEIATVKYAEVDGVTLPQEITIQHRNAFDQPIKEMPDLTFLFQNYRINKGAAAALLPAPAPPAEAAPAAPAAEAAPAADAK
ncbi:MAG: hypothetical protein ACYDCO_10390 [Armatimonadota bacterium]